MRVKYILIEIEEDANDVSIDYMACRLRKDFPELIKKIEFLHSNL